MTHLPLLAGRKISGAAWAVASCSHCRGRALTDGHPKRNPELAGGISHRFATAKDKLPGRGGGKNPGLSRKPAAVQRRQPPVKQGGYPVPRPSGGGTLWVGRPPHRWLRFATPLANFSLHSGQRWSRVTRAGTNPCRLCVAVPYPFLRSSGAETPRWSASFRWLPFATPPADFSLPSGQSRSRGNSNR